MEESRRIGECLLCVPVSAQSEMWGGHVSTCVSVIVKSLCCGGSLQTPKGQFLGFQTWL